MSFKIAHDAELDREIVRVIRWQAAEAARKAGAKKLNLTERVHVARTACKKVRAVLRLVREHDGVFYERENEWFRDSAQQLASYRDFDVMIDSVKGLQDTKPLAPTLRSFLVAEQERLETRRREEHAGTGSLGDEMERFVRRMRIATHRLARRRLGGLTFKAVVDGFVATYQKARHTMPPEGTKAAEKFHEWRKGTKMCGYQSRLLRDAWPAVMKAQAEAYSELGDILGKEHDLAMLGEHLMDRVGPESDAAAATSVLRLVEMKRDELHRRALSLGSRLFAEKPGAVGRHLELFWKTAGEK